LSLRRVVLPAFFDGKVRIFLKLFDLSGKTALITGSSQGIGWALAKALAAAGAGVVLNGRGQQRLNDVATELAAAGHTAHAVAFDVTDPVQVQSGISHVEERIAAIDILVNCAGIQHRSPLQDFAEADWQRLMKSNLDSVFLVSQAVARRMITRRRGKIINICSVQSELGRPGIAPYAASKGAVKMLTKGMCADWAPHGLQVNGLAPGYFVTELTRPLAEDADFSGWLCKRTPAGRWGRVEELGGACVFLASPAADFVNGQILYVDGGLTAVV
jgi:gluconate 5-dehydrogenase